MYQCLHPVATAIASSVLLHVPLTWFDLLGTCVIIAGFRLTLDLNGEGGKGGEGRAGEGESESERGETSGEDDRLGGAFSGHYDRRDGRREGGNKSNQFSNSQPHRYADLATEGGGGGGGSGSTGGSSGEFGGTSDHARYAAAGDHDGDDMEGSSLLDSGENGSSSSSRQPVSSIDPWDV